MIDRIHQKLGTAGFVIAIVALVAALSGGAYAAKGGLSGKQKKEVTKIAQTEAKKFAKQGKQGAPGPAGAKGDTGAAGPAGANGDAGAAGGAGAPGKSVVLGNAPASECPEGGTSVGVEGSGDAQFVCNGAEGPQGQPWTAGGTLPSGATETGAWGVNLQPGEFSMEAISLTIPLATAPDPVFVEGDSEPGCPGVVNGVPKADPGKLCLYSQEIFVGPAGPATAFFKPYEVNLGAGPSGTVLKFECEGNTNGGTNNTRCLRVGSWAVTAAS